MKIRSAFTLSEVLITLTIIGVIAAITMPILVQSYQKQVLTNRLRKSYSLVSQAFQKMMHDDGAVVFSETKYYKSRYTHDGFDTCMSKYVNVFRREYVETGDNNYLNLDKTPVTDELKSRLYLVDGTILFENGNNFFIDVNGEAGPNVMDRDLFKFTISSDGGLTPYVYSGGVVGYEKDEFGNDDMSKPIFGDPDNCTTSGCGAARIIKAGWKMNY